MLNTSDETKNTLDEKLDNVQAALDSSDNISARTEMKNFIDRVIKRSNFKKTKPDSIPLGEANNLVCVASNVLVNISLP